MAELLQATVPEALGLCDGGVRGLRIPILRETKMPAVVCDLAPLSVVVERAPALADALLVVVSTWVADPTG